MDDKKFGDIFWLVIAILFFLMGIYLILEDKVIHAFDELFQKDTIYGGYLLIMLGVLALLIWYNSLSPFGKIRRFIEGFRKRDDYNK